MRDFPRTGPLCLTIWLVFAAWCSATGCVLAVAGWLHGAGYLVSAAVTLLAAVFVFRGKAARLLPRGRWRVPRRRFRRVLPAVFLVVLILSGVGGWLSAPSNYDALTYRYPQMLHWLAEGRWHWIATTNLRMNAAAPGATWLSAPLLLLTGGDRLFFLWNWTAFALFPGVLFRFFRLAGVRPRAAWHWMWLVPCACGYALQAGSVANDAISAVLVVAALAFALHARITQRIGEVWLALLAAALCTGMKQVTLPLMLPCLVALWPSLHLLRRRAGASLFVLAVAAACSFLPSAISNTRHAGHWSGDPQDIAQIHIRQPLLGGLGNGLAMLVTHTQPPVWPATAAVNRQLIAVEESALGRSMRAAFPRFSLRWAELPTEETSPLGLGFCALVLIGLAGLFVRCRSVPRWSAGSLLAGASVVAFAVFLFSIGSESGARLALPYYPGLLLVVLRAPAAGALTRRGWWRALAVLAAASVLLPLVLSPARPLWPAQSFAAWWGRRAPESGLGKRVRLVYDVYAGRADSLARLRRHLPADAAVVGFAATADDSEVSLWRPWGSRKVIEVLHADPDDPALRALRGSVIVASARGLMERFQLTPEAFAERIHGTILARETLAVKASLGPEEWLVIAPSTAPAE